ncbi:MAG: ion transporter [Solobacterium sp.]|nr:ion transporter [Solobacterium sp.]
MSEQKKRVFSIIQIGNREDLPSRAFDYFIVAVILLNIACTFLETFAVMEPYMHVLRVVEQLTLLVFCVEYALRIWTAPLLYPGLTPWKAVVKFLHSYDGVVDLLTILPFFFLDGFIVFRMLRVVRIFHLFRINSYYDSFNVITSVLYEKRNQLLSSLFILVVLILASSLGMYSAEHEAQPELFKNALSGIWWSVSALLTVGYGDIYPITPLGRAMAIVISFLGVMAVAIPTGIISAGFVENYNEASGLDETFHTEIITVGIDSAWIGMKTKEIEERYGLKILFVKRNGEQIAPDGDTKMLQDDVLLLLENID